MKRILWVMAGTSLFIGTAAGAAEITVKLSDEDQQGFANLSAAVDQCVAALTLRSDAQMCKLVSVFVGQVGAKVAAAKPAPKPAK